MKKKISLIVCILVVIIIIIAVLPIIKPITINGNIIKYKYTVYSNHVEIEQYYGTKNKVKIPNYLFGRKVKVICGECFRENNEVEEIIFADNNEIIQQNAGSRCDNLKVISFGKNMKEIGIGAFSDCKNLNNIFWNNKIEKIGDVSFYACNSLKEVNLPDSVKYIGQNSFTDSGLENVYIPTTVQYIGMSAFNKTKWKDEQKEFIISGDEILIGYNGNESKIVIPQGVKIVNANFSNISKINEIYIPDSATQIGKSLLWKGKNITIYIPENVKNIGEGESIIEDITELTIVTTLGSYAEQYAKEQGIKCEIVDQIEYPTE